MENILIGADPELFCINPNSKSFVSVHDKLPGTKDNPYKVPFGAVQVDGTAAEFNIDPASNVEQFRNHIREVVATMGNMLPGYTLTATPVATYDEDYFRALPEKAVELGCNPDYNAYTGKVNPIPDARVMFRTGSGHVHIGWTSGADPFDPLHYAKCREVCVQLDYALGLNSLKWDTDNRRRELYGKAGAFRPKPYGVEYRVLSNKWVLDPALCDFVYNSTIKALSDLFDHNIFYDDFSPNLARDCINNNTYEDPPVKEVPRYV